MNNNKQIAETILEQLGGRKLIAMTGAHSFTADTNCLIFKLPRNGNAKHIAGVKITLTPADDYTVEFFKFQTKAGITSVVTVARQEGIYCDQLQETFETETGLLTCLVGRTI